MQYLSRIAPLRENETESFLGKIIEYNADRFYEHAGMNMNTI